MPRLVGLRRIGVGPNYRFSGNFFNVLPDGMHSYDLAYLADAAVPVIGSAAQMGDAMLDPEGWANGKLFREMELTDDATYTNGFPQGKAYLGTFVDNGPLDRDPAVGSFAFNTTALGLTPGTEITVAANYSADLIGTRNGRTHTSNFSTPVTLRAPVKIATVAASGATLTIAWTGGAAPYTLQRQTRIGGAWTNVATGITGTTATDTISSTEAYYRVVGN
jgi:hypothetical protein